MSDTEKPDVILYSKPGCGPCMASANAMTKAGIEFTKIDITVDPIAADTVKALGFAGVPVTVADGESWHGFREAKIKDLAHKFSQFDALASV
jgi:glutaredoxin-like protein NrdH